MKDAASEFWLNSSSYSHGDLSRIIARHHAAHLASKPSIWRPVSVGALFKDGSPTGHVTVSWDDGLIAEHSVDKSFPSMVRFWCRTADLLALVPLPKEKTQEEKDTEWIRSRLIGNANFGEDIKAAIAYGRATAQGGKV